LLLEPVFNRAKAFVFREKVTGEGLKRPEGAGRSGGAI